MYMDLHVHCDIKVFNKDREIMLDYIKISYGKSSRNYKRVIVLIK